MRENHKTMGEPEAEEGSALELLKFSDVLDYLGAYCQIVCEWSKSLK